MKKFKVVFKVFRDNIQPFFKEFVVEAGGKKVASIRAMGEINKLPECKNLFKELVSVEEV